MSDTDGLRHYRSRLDSLAPSSQVVDTLGQLCDIFQAAGRGFESCQARRSEAFCDPFRHSRGVANHQDPVRTSHLPRGNPGFVDRKVQENDI